MSKRAMKASGVESGEHVPVHTANSLSKLNRITLDLAIERLRDSPGVGRLRAYVGVSE